MKNYKKRKVIQKESINAYYPGVLNQKEANKRNKFELSDSIRTGKYIVDTKKNEYYNIRVGKKKIIRIKSPKKHFFNNRAFEKPSMLLYYTFKANNLYTKLFSHLEPYFFKTNYIFEINKKYKKSKKYSSFLLKKMQMLRIRLFYGIFSHRKYVRLLKNRSKADHYQSFLYSLMERRLDVVLYRSGFCRSIYTAQQMVRHGYVKVELKVIRNCFYPIKFYEKITFKDPETVIRMQYYYLMQLRLRRLFFKPVRYIIIDFLYMYIYVVPIIDYFTEIGLPTTLDVTTNKIVSRTHSRQLSYK